MNDKVLSSHLKQQFLLEFSPSERLYFLKTAKEAILIYKYIPEEDLYHYCYFLTQKKRLDFMKDPTAG
ncbi:MAG: hypothetical protein A2Y97_03165 [Nitrospirae bacterium RBG_13_39_12]|nr:MAG: hypothetical protein A2Y97_03165 [Nitrospirae bacterium RBG_13_39_12]